MIIFFFYSSVTLNNIHSSEIRYFAQVCTDYIKLETHWVNIFGFISLYNNLNILFVCLFVWYGKNREYSRFLFAFFWNKFTWSLGFFFPKQ